jgi:hypothetical protein
MFMAKEREDMPRTDVGKEMPKPGDGGKTGELGKQGGGEKKEWSPEKKEWGADKGMPEKKSGE